MLLLILKVVEVMDISFCLLINTLKTVNKIQTKCCLGKKSLYLKKSLTSSGTEDILLFFFFLLFLMYQTHENKDLFRNLSEQIAPKTKGNCLMIATVVATKI